MSLDYNEFYKRYGIRQSGHLLAPRVFATSLFVAPKRSIYHCIPLDAFQTAPDLTGLIYQNNTEPAYLYNVLELSSEVGKPRTKQFNAAAETRAVFIANKRFRRLAEVESRDKQFNEIVTVNYCFADKAYTYTRSAYRDYYEWYNLNRTVCNTMAAMLSVTTRNHFLTIALDKEVFATRMDMDRATKEDTIGMQTATAINTHTKRWIAEFWKWLSDTPSKSMLSALPLNQLDKVNVIFTCGTDFVVMNLGRLQQWKKPTAAQLKADSKLKNEGFEPAQLQKYFLFLLSKIQETTSTLIEEPSTGQSKKDKAALATKATKDNPNVPDAALAKRLPTANSNLADLSDTDEHEVTSNRLQAFDAQVDSDLEAMDAAKPPPEEKPEEAQDFLGDDEGSDDALLQTIDVGEVSADLTGVAVARKAGATPEEAIIAACDALASAGGMTAPTYRAYKEMAGTYKKIKSPDGVGFLSDFVTPRPEDLEIKPKQLLSDRRTIPDKSMLQSTLGVFDANYIRNVHHRNIAAMALAAQRGKVIMTGFEHERIEDIAGEYDTFSIKYQPIDGVPSTVSVKMPVVREDGTFYANGVSYRMRKQQFDLPIRKVSAVRVALTSYAVKTFVDRSERKASNYTAWIGNQVMSASLEPANPIVTSVAGGMGFDPSLDTPLVYSALGQRFLSFHYKDYVIYLKRADAIKNFDEAVRSKLETNGSIVVGWNGADGYLVIDKDSVWYAAKGAELTPLGPIENLLGLDIRNSPVPYVTLKVFGQDIPIGVCLAYLLGIDKLIKMLKLSPKVISVGQRYALEENEYAVVFADETLVFNRENVYASLIMAGFNEYHRFLRMYRYSDFKSRAVYANVLEATGLGVRFLRELVLLDDMFVDPITESILKRMKEPETFRGLLGRAVQLLCTDQHPDEIDTAEMRFRGYERFSGALYSELYKSMRVQRSRATRASKVIEMNPYAVWKTIMTDASVMPVKEINPIEYIKDTASVTFSGTGGRSGRTMVKGTRRYHPNSMGVGSEATVDSGDVGVNTYLSNNPQLNSVMGTTNRYEKDKTGASSMLSISLLLSPAGDKDEPRRAGFINIQNSHTVACDDYTQLPFRTGMEQVVPYQVSDLYASMAEEDGVVTKLTDRAILVTYKSGMTKAVQLGRRYGSAAGLTIPHTLVSPMKEGQAIRKGQTIAFNTAFFEEDLLNPGFLAFKFALLANVALFEDPLTHEDSCCISYSTAKRLNTQMTKVKNVTVNFDQDVTMVTKPGTIMASNDILCVIGDATTAGKNYFSDNSLDTLKMLSQYTPTAGIDGKLERIEVYYHGELEDMSESLRALAKDSDKQFTAIRKDMGKSAITGVVDEGFRIDGSPLALDSMVIRFYITTDVAAGIANKAVIAHQLKTVISKTIDDGIVSETGMPVDIFFGRKSLSARIVLSPDLIGTSTLILKLIGQHAVKAYKS